MISEFAANTQEDGTTTVTSQEIIEETTGLSFRVWVERYPDFVHSSGARVQRPWLQVEALSDDSERRIGLGVQKAKAVCALEHEMRDWVARGKALQQKATITLRLPKVLRIQSHHQS